MRIFACLAVVVAARQAVAQPAEVTAPAPLALPELVARQRWAASFGATAGLGALALAIDFGGTYALGDVELFADGSFLALGGICIEGCRTGDSADLATSNARAGARYIRAFGQIAIGPAVWSWLPTSTADMELWPRARAILNPRDSRAFLDEPAIGTSLDVAWRGATGFAQAQVGTAVVADGGPQIDNVFVTLATGARISERTSLLGEWRVDAYPREPWIHAVGIGMSRGDGDRRMWRLRFHVVHSAAGELEEGASSGTLAFDWVQRW